MRVLICGDRNWNDEETMLQYIKSLPTDTIIIQGECRGADLMAKRLAQSLGMGTLDFPADWTTYGRSAGPRRNKEMLDRGKPVLVVAFHNNLEESKGTKNMLWLAEKAGVTTYHIKSGDYA